MNLSVDSAKQGLMVQEANRLFPEIELYEVSPSPMSLLFSPHHSVTKSHSTIYNSIEEEPEDDYIPTAPMFKEDLVV